MHNIVAMGSVLGLSYRKIIVSKTSSGSFALRFVHRHQNLYFHHDRLFHVLEQKGKMSTKNRKYSISNTRRAVPILPSLIIFDSIINYCFAHHLLSKNNFHVDIKESKSMNPSSKPFDVGMTLGM
jgi:hypothetical protein